MRTPLNLIKGPLEQVLKENKVDADTREELQVMERNTERLLNLIHQLLDFRKTEAGRFGLTLLTANEYICLVRLKKAAQLLEEGRYRINEICFLTGFSSSSYFAKCFQKQFGMLPKGLVNRRKNSKE